LAGIAPATPIAHKGIAAASKVLVASYVDLVTKPERLAAIKADFAAQLAKYPAWKSLIPPDAKPPTHLNTAEMARYRDKLKPFEYDPNSRQSYLEMLKVAYPPAEVAPGAGKASNAPDAAANRVGG
jgi:aminobenzoyl-glutamate utilization protein B